jgi:hypothetical protein
MPDQMIRPGGCLCGAVTFRADCTELVMAAHCHCLDCRKATGSAFATVVALPEGGGHDRERADPVLDGDRDEWRGDPRVLRAVWFAAVLTFHGLTRDRLRQGRSV